MGKRILVTGGAGFIGSHIVEGLLLRGDEVVVVDDFSSGRKENLPRDYPDKSCSVLCLDVRARLEPAFTPRPDAVVHLAAIPSVPYSLAHPVETNDVHVNGTLHLLETCRLSGVRRFVFASSAAVYGEPSTLPISEATPVNPLSPYALQKRIGELYAERYDSLYGLEPVCLRFFNIYGPRMSPESPYAGVIARFLHALQNDQQPVVAGDGEQTRDFCYVADVVTSVLAAIDATNEEVWRQPLNIGSGTASSVNEVLRLLQEITGSTASPRHEPARNEIRHSLADSTLARQLLRLPTATPLHDGLTATTAALSS